MEHETIDFDVVIVGAGIAGLSAACRLMQNAKAQERELSVCVLEKGAHIGAHILSGAVFETTALDELFPDWQERGAPLNTPVSSDEVHFFTGAQHTAHIPAMLAPPTLNNHGNFIISLGELVEWLGQQATELGVEIFTGFAAQSVIYDEDGSVKGVLTGDMGVTADGEHKDNYMPGMALHGTFTLFAEGARGHLGKSLIQQFDLADGKNPQHFALGIKEVWEVPEAQHQPGKVIHTAGWPLAEHDVTGGGFLYHLNNQRVAVGLITDLNYHNPHIAPFHEFQRFKQHPTIKAHLAGGKRLGYGARAINKGGLQSLPTMTFPGGALIGCDAGTLNSAKIKGSHCAMKSATLMADCISEALTMAPVDRTLANFAPQFEASWLYKELHQQRNFTPAMHRFGTVLGASYGFMDLNLLRGKAPWTLQDPVADHDKLLTIDHAHAMHYDKPDNEITFDLLNSLFLSATNHSEDQPCHLKLKDVHIPIDENLPLYDEPAQRYCPAGVYEVIETDNHDAYRFHINAQNCLHCKTCDIKDPSQNITWTPPEGGGGPNYSGM